MRVLHIGDIVGRPGRKIVLDVLPKLRAVRQIDLVIANGENIAGGSGITPKLFRDLLGAGVDCVTLGDHIYRRREIYAVLEADEPIVKPANYPLDAPGKCWTVVHTPQGIPVVVFSLLGRVFMRPVDCPWSAADRVLREVPADVRVRWLDFHAEATSDKQTMARYLDGRVTAVIGTHTHVPTADEVILPGGTAFQADVGMTGPHDGILGRRTDRVLATTISFRPLPFDVATGDVRLNAALVDVDEVTGKAVSIERICVREQDADRL